MKRERTKINARNFPGQAPGVFALAFALGLTLAFPCLALAQRTVTLDSCLQIAREHSIALRLSDKSLQSTHLVESEIRSAYFPLVRFSAGASYAPVAGFSGYDPAISNSGQLSGQIVAQQSLYDAGVRSLKLDQNQIDLERVHGERRVANRDLTYSVASSFIDLLRAQQATVMEEAGVQQLEDYLRLVTQMMHGGAASRTDFLKVQVQLNNARLALSSAQQELALARAALADAMGNPADTAIVADGILESPPADNPAVYVQPLTTGNLELQIAEMDLKTRLLDIEIAGRERWPVLSLNADAGWLSSVDNLRLPRAERYTGFGYAVGITMELPLLSWGGVQSRIEQRQVEAETQRLVIERLSRSTQREILSTQIQMRNTLAAIQSARTSIQSAEENYLLTKSTYAGGGTTSLDVLNAQQLLLDNRRAEVRFLATWHLLKAKLAQMTAQ